MKKQKPPEEKPPRKKYLPAWKDPDVKLELYISPDLKLRLGLAPKTTTEYLEERERKP